jgi:hypothetical protein
MNRSTLVLSLLMVVALPAHAAGPRTLTETLPAGGIDTVDVGSGIGDVSIVAVDGAEEISVEVILTPRRGGIFSSKRQAEREVEAASLRAATKGGRLVLSIQPPADDDRRFEERWTIGMPPQIALTLDHGVGDIAIQGITAGVEIDSGVGDIEVDAADGDVVVDLGVGTAVVLGRASAYRTAEAAGGVGDASLTVLGERISGGGFVSHSTSWTGNGTHRIEVSVGVGDAVVTLD